MGLSSLVTKGHMWDWRLEQQATLEKTKILVQKIKVLDISQSRATTLVRHVCD